MVCSDDMEGNRLVSKVKIGYKLVRTRPTRISLFDDQRLSSCFITSKYEVIYELDRWVKPQRNCGPLSVFESVETAMTFMKDFFGLHDNLQVWKCEYTRSHYTKVWTPFRRNPFRQFPTGTILADEVKLIEKIS